jgi:hypothetical protein
MKWICCLTFRFQAEVNLYPRVYVVDSLDETSDKSRSFTDKQLRPLLLDKLSLLLTSKNVDVIAPK